MIPMRRSMSELVIEFTAFDTDVGNTISGCGCWACANPETRNDSAAHKGIGFTKLLLESGAEGQLTPGRL